MGKFLLEGRDSAETVAEDRRNLRTRLRAIARRKGQEYGTILVNMDLHRVVDLSPDRAALPRPLGTFADFLTEHRRWRSLHRQFAPGARDRGCCSGRPLPAFCRFS